MSSGISTAPAVKIIPAVPAPKIMLVGATGSGKTYVLRTLVEAGLEVFVLFSEPGMEVLADVPADKLHWHYVPPATPDWKDMVGSAEKINTLSFQALTSLSDINKGKYKEFIELLKCMANFTDDRTGMSFGPIDNFGPDKAFVVDSLSGLNIAAMNLVVGSKPVKSMSDWGVAMDNLERLITKLTTGLDCTFVMTAHLERETDEQTGGTQLMASTLGRKLAPRLPRFFSDVVHCRREGDKFFWSTVTSNVDLKARNLPFSDKLPPSFKPIIENWRKHNADKMSPAVSK